MTPMASDDSNALAPLGVEVNETPNHARAHAQENRTCHKMTPVAPDDSNALAPLGVEVNEIPITRERMLEKIAQAIR